MVTVEREAIDVVTITAVATIMEAVEIETLVADAANMDVLDRAPSATTIEATEMEYTAAGATSRRGPLMWP